MKICTLTRLITRMVTRWKINFNSNPIWRTNTALKVVFRISQRHVVRLPRDLEGWSRIARRHRSLDQNSKFGKFKRAENRHFVRGYIGISQPQYVQFQRNLVRWCELWFWEWTRDEKSKFCKSKTMDGRRLENRYTCTTKTHYYFFLPTSTKPRTWKLSKMLDNGCNGFSFEFHL